MNPATLIALLMILVVVATGPAHAGFGTRRDALLARGELMLAENLPHRQQDCSSAVWRLLTDLWPELALTKWFRRTTADAMAGWPWPAVMSVNDLRFGDLLFTGSKVHLDHVMVRWVKRGTAVHAASSKGFSLTNLEPYWMPKLQVAVRPPY